MPTNREIYFKLLKENNKYLNKNVIISLLVDASKYDDRMVLYANFDKEVSNLEHLLINVDLINMCLVIVIFLAIRFMFQKTF